MDKEFIKEAEKLVEEPKEIKEIVKSGLDEAIEKITAEEEEDVKDSVIVESDDKLNLSRQAKMVDVEKINNFNLKVFGVGSVGSHTVKCLGKTGFKNFEVYDMDVVERGNIAAQAFDFKHIKMNKVDAMKEIMKESCGVDINIHHGKVTKETDIGVEPDDIICCFFDSIEARKMLFEKVKGYPILFVDTRIGKYHIKYYFVDCGNSEEVAKYEKTLGIEAAPLECGEKASAPVNLQLAGMVTMNLVNYTEGKAIIKKMEGNAAYPQYNMFEVQKND